MGKTVNPNGNLHVPKWINAEYFEKVLANDGEVYEKIENLTAVAATPVGENFTSVMLRIHLDLDLKDGSKKHKTYVMKTMLDDERGGTEIKRLEFFPKELQMYRTFLPAFEGLYKAAGKTVKLAPRCLLAESRGNRIHFVFEDLSSKGYVNAERVRGLNMDEMRRSLQRMAEFHAASVIYFEQNGPYPDIYKFSFVPESTYDIQKETYDIKVDQFKEAMKTWGLEDVDKYLDKFPTLEQYWKCNLRMLDTEKNSFNVLNHADVWSSNIMYTYLQNGKVDDILLLDYQICKWGSPAEDLLFFITNSAAKDIRIKEYEKFVAIYHEHLVDCLKLLGYKKPLPKLRNLQMDMYSETNSFYAFFAVFNHLPVILFPSDKESNFENLLSTSEDGKRFRLRIFKNPAFKEAMLDILPFYYNRGVFNFSDYDN